MAFLAALGVISALSNDNAVLEWTDNAVPIAVLHTTMHREAIVSSLYQDMKATSSWALMDQKKFKLSGDALQHFLQSGGVDERKYKAALLSDVTVDGKGDPKPTDLYFCAGQQSFMGIAKGLSESVTEEEIEEAIFGPWQYQSVKRGTFMWDTRDDRNYALMATNPVTTDKTTIPGCDWLAFRGIGLLPSFGTMDRILTPGTSGRWKNGFWAWVLWRGAIGPAAIRTLMQSVPRGTDSVFTDWIPTRGVFRVYQSQIVRSDQGGYGTIRPPKQVWSEAS